MGNQKKQYHKLLYNCGMYFRWRDDVCHVAVVYGDDEELFPYLDLEKALFQLSNRII